MKLSNSVSYETTCTFPQQQKLVTIHTSTQYTYIVVHVYQKGEGETRFQSDQLTNLGLVTTIFARRQKQTSEDLRPAARPPAGRCSLNHSTDLLQFSFENVYNRNDSVITDIVTNRDYCQGIHAHKVLCFFSLCQIQVLIF